jgi:hypothetical protein
MKKNNPHTPILIREAKGVEPKMWARYGKIPCYLNPRCRHAERWAGYGKEASKSLSGGPLPYGSINNNHWAVLGANGSYRAIGQGN